MEFCDGGTLEDAMHSGRFHGTDAQGRAVADMERVCLTLLDIVKAMEYLHLMRIFLKDLKPKNVLLASSKVRSLSLSNLAGGLWYLTYSRFQQRTFLLTELAKPRQCFCHNE